MYKDKINAYFEEHRQEILDDIMTLCRIRSVREEAQENMPFGPGPKAALDAAIEMSEKMGFKVRNFDNYVATVDINDKESQLAILAHLDVVHEGKGWTVCKPYEPVVKGDRIYGRGTADDKGPAVVSLWALKAIKDLGIELSKNARIILGTAEETGSQDLAYYCQKEAYPPMSFSPDSSFPVTNIEKGGFGPTLTANFKECKALPRVLEIKGGTAGNIVCQECYFVIEGMAKEEALKYLTIEDVKFTVSEENGLVRVDVVGQSAHASTPHLGVNSITASLAVLSKMPMAESKGFSVIKGLSALIPHGDYLGAALGVKQEDELSGPLTLNLGILEYTTTGLTGKIDSRTPICANEDNMSKIVNAKMNEIGIELNTTTMRKPHHTPAESEFIKVLNGAYEEYTGNEGYCVAIGGGTYVHNIEGGVAFGCSMPGTENNMHGPDESAVIEELMVSGKMFADIIVRLCK